MSCLTKHKTASQYLHHTEKVLPKVQELDDEIATLLGKLLTDYAKADIPADTNSSNLTEWKKVLADHPEGELQFGFLESGYPLGLRKDLDPNQLSKRVHNFVNTREDCIEMLKRIHKELGKSQIRPGEGHYQLNLLCVPKKDGATGLMTMIRVARHGSYTKSEKICIDGVDYGCALAINDGITDEARRMTLPGFMDYIRQLYPFKYFALRDLKDAFRQLLLALCDREYIQYCIFALKFQDLRVAYGTASSAARCQDFAMLITWICHKHLPEFQTRPFRMNVHVDDFLICAYEADECELLWSAFDSLLKKLNVGISIEKNENGIQRGVVHGIGFKCDVPHPTILVPKRKAIKATSGCALMIIHGRATGEALESITGLMMHHSRQDVRAKSLCNRGIRQIHLRLRKMPKQKKKYTIFVLSEDWKRSLSMFLRYFPIIREVTMESLLFPLRRTISASSDACDSGGGFLVADRWYAYKFKDVMSADGYNHLEMHINMKEAHAILMLLFHFRHLLTGRKLWLLCDNQVCVYTIAKAWSSAHALMDMVQEISMMCMEYCIGLRIDYIPTWLNGPSDMLSRGCVGDFKAYMKAWKMPVIEQHNVEYYESLRLMNSPITLPKWLFEDDGIKDKLNQSIPAHWLH